MRRLYRYLVGILVVLSIAVSSIVIWDYFVIPFKFQALSPQRPPEKKLPQWIVFKSSENQCMKMMDSFCDQLFSPDALGNMLIDVGNKQIPIRQGRDESGLTLAFLEYARANIQFRRNLPLDFFQILKRNQFFNKYEIWLNQKDGALMKLSERVESVRAQTELNAIWKSAMDEAVLLRMEKLHPDYSKIQPHLLPVEIRYAERRQKDILVSEIYKGIWSKHPNWKKVENNFQIVKQNYLDFIKENEDIPEDVKSRWLTRIQQTQLELPGSDPSNLQTDCSETDSNAYFFHMRDKVTVCAGDFNT